MDSRSVMAAAADPPAGLPAPATAHFRCEEALRTQVACVLQLFQTEPQRRVDDSTARHFLQAAEALASWAAEAARPSLAQTLRQTAADFGAIYDSPLDLDRQSLGLLWEPLAPELAALEGEPPSPARDPEAPLVAVRPERLEALVEPVSHLSLTAELYGDLETRLTATPVPSALLDEMRQINRQLKSQATALTQGVVALRRVPIAALLAEAAAHAQALATAAGKRLAFKFSGTATEIDPALVENVRSLLTHLVEHAVPFSLETPALRRRRGQSEVGQMRLDAESRGSRLCLSLRDDGPGIGPDGLRTVADLVEQWEGEFHVVPAEQGTTIRIEIPQRDTLRAIDTLLVEHAGQCFAIPFEQIVEIVELGPGDLKPVQGRQVIALRGELFDALSLSEVLHLDRSVSDPHPRQGILVECKRGALCLLVERVVGHRQAVVQPLDGLAAGNAQLAGVSPLGGGRLALVLHIPAVLRRRLG